MLPLNKRVAWVKREAPGNQTTRDAPWNGDGCVLTGGPPNCAPKTVAASFNNRQGGAPVKTNRIAKHPQPPVLSLYI